MRSLKSKGPREKNEIIFVLGPTASGKTAVAYSLAISLGAEVISCDSMQVYQGMDILTQAPDEGITEKVTHHLVRILSPEKEYNAARFAREASGKVTDIISRGRRVVFAGGTGLYVKAFLDGIFALPGKDEPYRRSLREIAQETGREQVHAMLKSIDPETAKKLHPNDLKRTIRALEIHKLTGRSKEDLIKLGERPLGNRKSRLFALNLPREKLYSRINHRVDEMMEKGLIKEVSLLRDRKISKTASQALGFREVSEYLDGCMTLEETCELIKKNTRNYAKRQLTWLRGEKRVEWVDASEGPDITADRIMKKIEE